MTAALVDRVLLLSRILFGAMFVSLGIYAAIAVIVTGSNAAPPPMPELTVDPFGQPLVLALGGTAVTMLVVTAIVRVKLMPPRRRISDAPRNVSRALARLRAAELVSWALCEAVAINGLILTMLSHDPQFTYGFSAVAALAMLVYAPSRRRIDDVVRAATPD